MYELFASGRRTQPCSAFSLVDDRGGSRARPRRGSSSPPLGGALEHLGGAIRYERTLPARAREIVILLVGHHHRSPFEVLAHTKAGAAAGLSQADLDALAAGQAPELTTEEERVIVRGDPADPRGPAR